jgi:PAS domain S-box-containing protein
MSMGPDWLHTVLSSIGDAVIATDDCARVKWLNPVAEALTGWRRDEALDRPLDEVFRIVDEQARRPVERVFRDGAVVGLANHTILIARDGTERPIDDSAAPIQDASGRTSGVVLIFRDLSTDRPPTGEVDYMLADGTVRHAAAAVTAIKDDAGRVIVLIVEGRDNTDRIRAEAALRDSEHRWRTMAEALPNLVRTDLPDGQCDWLSSQWGKYTGIPEEQLLEYTEPRGHIELEVRRDCGAAALGVRDDGIGIAAEMLPRIFELFVQVDHAATRSQGGLGVGLTLVKNLVEMHGETIKARSGGLLVKPVDPGKVEELLAELKSVGG